MPTTIEWTDATWNPIAGCTKVSPGCAHCYAERMAKRLKAMGRAAYQDTIDDKGRWTGRVTLVDEKLDDPLHWKKPRMIFVNSMSDLFHDEVPFEFVDDVFARMFIAGQHTYQILTKRPERMYAYMARYSNGGFSTPEIVKGRVNQANGKHPAYPLHGWGWPLPNVWLGTSVENQEAADGRIPWLLRVPAAVHFLSCEPLLGPIELDKLTVKAGNGAYAHNALIGRSFPFTTYPVDGPKIDWVIAGGESGPKARPMHPDWARSIRDQCQIARVPFFFKQWGEWLWVHPDRKSYEFSSPTTKTANIDGMRFYRIGKKSAGRLLDGREWSEYPATEAANV